MSAISGSDRARRTAIQLLSWYPRPWRMRYEQEMRALVEDLPVGWKQVGNLAITGGREWLSPRAFGWPARSAASRLWKLRFLTFLACAYALDGVARLLGWLLFSAGVEISESVGIGAAFLGLAFAVRVCLEGAIRLSKGPWAVRARQRGWSGKLRDWEVVLWAVLIFPSMVMRYAQAPPEYLSAFMVQTRPYVHVLQVYVWTWLAFLASARTHRLNRIQGSHLQRALRPLDL